MAFAKTVGCRGQAGELLVKIKRGARKKLRALEDKIKKSPRTIILGFVASNGELSRFDVLELHASDLRRDC